MEAAKAVTRGVNIERCVSCGKRYKKHTLLFAFGFELEQASQTEKRRSLPLGLNSSNQPKLKNAALCHDYHGWWKWKYCRSIYFSMAPRHCSHGCEYLGFVRNNYMDVIGRTKQEPESNIYPDRTSCTSTLLRIHAFGPLLTWMWVLRICPEHKSWPYILNNAAPCHPWHRVIPYILYITQEGHPRVPFSAKT